MSCEYNILIDPLPDTVVIDGEEHRIASDFRTGILFELMINDPELSEEDRGLHALNLWYPDGIPENMEEAALRSIWFYSCGKRTEAEIASGITRTQDASSRKARFNKRIYDFDIDAPLIYSAFLTQYKIDLQDVEHLHWWKFSALFSSLNEDCEIAKIMGYRALDLGTIKNKQQRAHYAKLQQKYALPSLMTTEQKEAAAGAVFATMMGGHR